MGTRLGDSFEGRRAFDMTTASRPFIEHNGRRGRAEGHDAAGHLVDDPRLPVRLREPEKNTRVQLPKQLPNTSSSDARGQLGHAVQTRQRAATSASRSYVFRQPVRVVNLSFEPAFLLPIDRRPLPRSGMIRPSASAMFSSARPATRTAERLVWRPGGVGQTVSTSARRYPAALFSFAHAPGAINCWRMHPSANRALKPSTWLCLHRALWLCW